MAMKSPTIFNESKYLLPSLAINLYDLRCLNQDGNLGILPQVLNELLVCQLFASGLEGDSQYVYKEASAWFSYYVSAQESRDCTLGKSGKF
jgi:hypothetical protein